MARNSNRNFFLRFLTGLVVTLTVIISAGFLLSAYSGMLSPLKWRFAPLIVMTFPMWLLAQIAVFIIDVIWWRRTAVFAFVVLLVALPSILNFCPFNLPKGSMSPKQQEEAFTLMTYNVMQFVNQDKSNVNEFNEQLDYILSVSPDVVCIEEAEYMGTTPSTRITPEQLQQIREMYPYVFFESREFAFLSKYEAEAIPINFPKSKFSSGDIAGWRFYKNGTPVNVFVVHLCSFGFNASLKSLFRELTTPDKVDKQNIRDARYKLMPRVVSSSRERARQVSELRQIIKKFGGENTIVCGDFNDPVGSYPLYYLHEYCDLQQMYRKVGFGPMITYNANHFFFRIDHILYRGDLVPYSIKRGSLRASDHYPLIATFLLPK